MRYASVKFKVVFNFYLTRTNISINLYIPIEYIYISILSGYILKVSRIFGCTLSSHYFYSGKKNNQNKKAFDNTTKFNGEPLIDTALVRKMILYNVLKAQYNRRDVQKQQHEIKLLLW